MSAGEAVGKVAGPAPVDMKFEIVVIPVSDADRAKEFYSKLGWRLDADYAHESDFRVLQFTPPGSSCSVIFGKNVTAAKPGSSQGMYLIVSDVEAARRALIERGIEVSEVFHGAGDKYVGPDEPYIFGAIRVAGPDPNHGSYRSFASFKDPDGNGWLFQEITTRLPGRIDCHHVAEWAVVAALREMMPEPRRTRLAVARDQDCHGMNLPWLRRTDCRTDSVASRLRSDRENSSRLRFPNSRVSEMAGVSQADAPRQSLSVRESMAHWVLSMSSRRYVQHA